MLPDPYPVQPWTSPCRGEVKLPGSKSLTNRALIVAAMCDGPVLLKGALFSRDSRLLLDGLHKLGFSLTDDAETESIEVTGLAGNIPKSSAHIHVGNAGTAARFLTAFVCLHPNGEFFFDGDEEMRKRPMEGLLNTLQSLGARFEFKGEAGCFPFVVKTSGLSAGLWQVDASASSQMLSALMLVSPMAQGKVSISAKGARPSFVEMTAGLMRQFGITITGSPDAGYTIAEGQHYSFNSSDGYAIEPDATAASYFMALPMVTGGTLKIPGMQGSMLQGDTAFAIVMQKLGMQVRQSNDGWTVSFSSGVDGSLFQQDFQKFSDTFLTLAAISPLLPGPVRMDGIGHTRFQETDRIEAVTTELQRIGAEVRSGEDWVEISPFNPQLNPAKGTVVQTYRDHRVAMSFALLGCSKRFGVEPWLSIADPGCCGKTFPEFFGELEKLYRNSHDK